MPGSVDARRAESPHQAANGGTTAVRNRRGESPHGCGVAPRAARARQLTSQAPQTEAPCTRPHAAAAWRARPDPRSPPSPAPARWPRRCSTAPRPRREAPAARARPRRRRHLRPRTRGRHPLPAPPRPDRRRARRRRDLGMIRRCRRAPHGATRRPRRHASRRGAASRCCSARLGIAADGVFGPGTARAVRSLPARPRAHRRRRRRAGDLVGARRPRPPPGAQARPPAPRRRPAARPAGRRRAARSPPATASPASPTATAAATAASATPATTARARSPTCCTAAGRSTRPLDSGELMSWGRPAAAAGSRSTRTPATRS